MDFSSGITRLHSRRSWPRPLGIQSRGFSLIELMVIVAILGIFAAIALPNFSSMLRSSSVRAGADELYDLLQYARAEAVTRSTKVNISGSATGSISVSTSTTTLRQTGSAGLQPGVTISSPVSSVDFSATGTASASTCFQLTYTGDSTIPTRYIAILSSGRVTAPSTTKPSGC